MFFLQLFHMHMIHLIGLVKKSREMEVPALVADTNISVKLLALWLLEAILPTWSKLNLINISKVSPSYIIHNHHNADLVLPKWVFPKIGVPPNHPC